ncbi:MAG: hypothetical protein U0931_08365 [Vulcanimicrobiota bacterium]
MINTRPTRVFTINGLYRAFDRQIEAFSGAIGEEVYYLDINFDHPPELGPDDFGVYWIASLCNTGHQHIVVIPLLGQRPDAWPVAFYDQDTGCARLFASSLRNWFPSYLIHLSEVSNYRRYFPEFASELVNHCRNHFDFDATRLVEGRGNGSMAADEAYELTEPGGYLHRYWQLCRSQDPQGMRELATSVPFFNLPLGWLLKHSLATAEDCLRLLRRPLNYDLDGPPARWLHKMDPCLSSLIRETPYEGFLTGSAELPGLLLHEGRKLAEEARAGEAMTHFQNAAWLARGGRDPKTQLQALAAARELALAVRDRGYLSYLKELTF